MSDKVVNEELLSVKMLSQAARAATAELLHQEALGKITRQEVLQKVKDLFKPRSEAK